MNQTRMERIAEAEHDLYRHGFGWVTNNGGVHLQVVFKGIVIADMWPTTGKLIMRKIQVADYEWARETLNKIKPKPSAYI